MENNGDVPKEYKEVTTPAEQLFDFASLSPETQQLYGSETQFNTMMADWMNKLGEDDRNVRYIEERLHPQFPEKPEFAEEITHPEMIKVGSDEHELAVYRLNQGKQGAPVIVNMSWSVGADSRSGRPFLKALCDQLDRPVIIIDPIATGKSSIPSQEFVKKMDFDTLASLEIEALTKVMGTLPEEGVDIVGISMGGVRAIKQAELLQEKVKSVTTVSTPGFEKRNPLAFAHGFLATEAKNWEKLRDQDAYLISEDTAFYATPEQYGPKGVTFDTKNLPLGWRMALGAVKPVMKMFTGNMEPEQFSADRVPSFVRFFSLMTRNNVGNAVDKLAPQTRWNDVIGSDDAITKYDDHLATVRARNGSQASPNPKGKSNVHIVGGFNHSWTTQHTQMASTIGTLLRKG